MLVGFVLASFASTSARGDTPTRTTYSDGSVRSEGTLVDGERHGTFRFYAPGGGFLYQAHYVHGLEVWRSTQLGDVVPVDRVARVEASFRWRKMHQGRDVRSTAPVFALLDRTLAARRVGAQIGIGGGGSPDAGTIARLDAHAHVQLPEVHVDGELVQSMTSTTDGRTAIGKTVLSIGVGKRGRIAEMPIAFRIGVAFPIVNDNTDGFRAGAAGSLLRPADASLMFPSTSVLRSSTSARYQGRGWIAQLDVGADLAIGGFQVSEVEPLVRANAGIGLGRPSRMIALELANTVRMRDLADGVHAIGLSGSHGLGRWILTGSIAVTTSTHASLMTTVTHDL